MPKEKAAPRKTRAAKSESGKKKKGKSHAMIKHSSEYTKLTPPPDPNAPKRGLSAYMFFANEQREKVRTDDPSLKFGLSQLSFTTDHQCRRG